MLVLKGIDLIYFVPTIFLSMLSIYAFYRVEKVKQDENIQTYKEITALMENRSLSDAEKKIEAEHSQRRHMKSRLLKFFLGASVGVLITLVVDVLLQM